MFGARLVITERLRRRQKQRQAAALQIRAAFYRTACSQATEKSNAPARSRRYESENKSRRARSVVLLDSLILVYKGNKL